MQRRKKGTEREWNEKRKGWGRERDGGEWDGNRKRWGENITGGERDGGGIQAADMDFPPPRW
jgi:hypothetical protein